MIARSRQVRNLIFFFLLLPCLTTPVHAKNVFKSTGQEADRSGPQGAGGNKVYSISDLFSGVGQSLSDLLPKDEPEKTEPEKEDSDPTLIKAHRLDPEPAKPAPKKKKEDVPPAPYKVYAAPMIPEETPVLPSSDPKEAADFDPSKPPPIKDLYLHTNLDDLIVAPTTSKKTAPLKARQSLPPVNALPKQFLPIFPYASSDDSAVQLLPIASNYDLTANHDYTTRAIIVIHDIQRNSSESVATLMTLAGSNGEQTLILAPHFALDVDIIRFAKHLPDKGRQVARWSLEDPWQYGGESRLTPKSRGVSSFTAMDILLLLLSDRERFPSLRQVILVGHGIGGDFVQRYAALGQAPDILAAQRLPVRFVVANPSSYFYMTHMRPAESGRRFINPDVKACPKLDDYPYGLKKLPAYAKRKGANAIRMRYPLRSIYIFAGKNISGDNLLDRGCEAAAQGKTRLSRAQSFEYFIHQSYGEAAADQPFTFVSGAGYDPVALYGSYCGLSALFGNGKCGQ
ncbi:MAG: hypothetical protein AB7E52_09070 [Bdellovibrionales bacterium]